MNEILAIIALAIVIVFVASVSIRQEKSVYLLLVGAGCSQASVQCIESSLKAMGVECKVEFMADTVTPIQYEFKVKA
jgi:hypothetical protein